MRARSGMEIIARDECLRLLATQSFGRLGFVVDDQPLILPVNFALEADIVLFRSGEGTKLEAASGAKVAFEVDEVDVGAATAWSVLVQGVAEEISDDPDYFAEVLRRAAAPTWVPGPGDHYMRILPTGISARRLSGPRGTAMYS